MKRIRIIHRLRVTLALLAFLGVVAAVGLLCWANHTGLPESWRSGIEDALARSGMHAELGSLRYLPLRGIEASDVVVYSDSSRERVVVRLDQLILDIDRTKLSRGDFSVQELDLSGATVALAVDLDDPDTKVLEISDARGRLEFSGDRQLEISRLSGMVGGLRLEGRALLKLYRPDSTGTLEDIERGRQERRRLLLAVIDALEQFEVDATAPPRLRVDARGDLEVDGSMRAKIDLRAANLTSRGVDIRRLDVDGELRGSTLALHRIDLETPSGNMNGKLEYELGESRGRFELSSTADLPALLEQVGVSMPENPPSFEAPPKIDAYGTIQRLNDCWRLQLIGDLELIGPRFAHLSADRLTSRFSTRLTFPPPSQGGSDSSPPSQGNCLLLEDLNLRHETHQLEGRVFITPEEARYQIATNLPVDYLQNAVTIQPLSDVLDDFSDTAETATRVEASGMANFNNPLDWWFKGHAEATSLSFRGVPTRHAQVEMDLDHHHLDFIDGKVDFDFSDYRLKKDHGGPSSGTLKVDRIIYDNENKTVGIEDLQADVWPAPVVRTFAADIADEIEVYRFHRPPRLSAEGLIGIESGLPLQDLTVTFSTTSSASYEFLDKDLTLSRPSGSVRILPRETRISDLDAAVLNGRIRADITSILGRRRQRLEGEIDWTHLSLPDLATTYDLESQLKGSITGRMDFSIDGTDVGGLNGEGHVALEDGELFDVPVFGPLSPVISAVLGRRQAGFQEANDAFCTFEVEDGVVSTTDFLTTTPSLVFTGDGWADLPDEKLEMTVRMNARGLFGVITLPLRPFYGLFQFRGTGPIDDPEWKNVMFTSPPAEQENRLLDPPRARPVGAPPRARVVSPPGR